MNLLARSPIFMLVAGELAHYCFAEFMENDRS